MAKKMADEILTCGNCGHTGPDVKEKYIYIGGQGEVLRRYCPDLVACFKRQEEREKGAK